MYIKLENGKAISAHKRSQDESIEVYPVLLTSVKMNPVLVFGEMSSEKVAKVLSKELGTKVTVLRKTTDGYLVKTKDTYRHIDEWHLNEHWI